MASYLRPVALDDALAALADGRRAIVAGGTDYYPARVGQPLDDDVLDITGIAGLRAIVDEGPHWRIPALATWTDLVEADLPPLFDGLKLAAREIGGAQIQNAGTLVGNVCNASPAADGVPPLLTLDTRVELRSAAGGTRALPLDAFVAGNRRTHRAPEELATALLIPKPNHPAVSGFVKLGARAYLVISIVMAAGVVEAAPDGTVAAARLAVGSCSAVAQRLLALEEALAGRPLSPDLADVVAPAHLAPLAPIDDVRGTAAYRLDAAETLLRRLLVDLAERRR